MRKRLIALLLTWLLTASVTLAAAESGGIAWTKEARARLRVGNPTAMEGKFFTTMWGGTTSDLDVQDLLHGYALACYDPAQNRYRLDRSVVQDAVILNDEEGNRTYLLVLYNDLYWSDGNRITAYDYAFSILFCMDPVIRETGGIPADCSWLCGAEEYLNGESQALSGLRVIADDILQIRVRAEALPYFYEMSRLQIHPYPASVIAPGISVTDEGEGAHLSGPLTAETIRQTVLDPEKGYLSHPSVVSGPYVLTDYKWPTAQFEINSRYKGTEEGMLPRIGELEVTLAKNESMAEELEKGEFGLLNKVTLSDTIQKAIQDPGYERYDYTADSYARSGLTMLWFVESSAKVQDQAVRKAIAYCFDREGMTREYAGLYGLKMDGFYGLGQWMVQLTRDQISPPVDEEKSDEENRKTAEAFAALNLDGLTRYEPDRQEAEQLLESAGWTRNAQEIRHGTLNGITTELRLVLGLPESEKARSALETYLVRNLEEAGVAVTLKTMPMDEIVKAYRSGSSEVDLLYLGEDFPVRFDPEMLAPQAEATSEGSLSNVKAELYAMAQDMVRTEPEDYLGFMQKWIALQERITGTLPLIPVYSNVYFDLYTRELHNYRITQAVTWAEAIVGSYMSDAETVSEE